MNDRKHEGGKEIVVIDRSELAAALGVTRERLTVVVLTATEERAVAWDIKIDGRDLTEAEERASVAFLNRMSIGLMVMPWTIMKSKS